MKKIVTVLFKIIIIRFMTRDESSFILIYFANIIIFKTYFNLTNSTFDIDNIIFCRNIEPDEISTYIEIKLIMMFTKFALQLYFMYIFVITVFTVFIVH